MLGIWIYGLCGKMRAVMPSVHAQVKTCAELQTVHEALFDHRRSHPCEWSKDATLDTMLCLYQCMHVILN